MYTAKQSEKMNRLSLQLAKIGYRLRGIHDGFGQLGIEGNDKALVQESEYWIADFVVGELSGRHICKGLKIGKTPYAVAASSLAKKSKRPKQ